MGTRSGAADEQRSESLVLERYTVAEAIGRGQYGKVFLAVDKESGERVAVKRMRVVPRETTLRVKEGGRELNVPALIAIEIKILRLLSNEHVVKLRDVIYGSAEIFLVFEYMEHDMCGLLQNAKFTTPQIKCYLKQLLEGLHYCHVNGIMHRDIKLANLLVSAKGVLKIADFGMSAAFSPPNNTSKMHCGVVTLWNRPPELLLGFANYNTAVDMWSVGCVFAELLVRKSILPGKDEDEQLYWIFNLCGTPDETSWPGVSKSEAYRKFLSVHDKRESRLRKAFSNVDPLALDLLERMLTLDPAKRITAQEALLSDYLWSEPRPCNPSDLPIQLHPCNEFRVKQKRREVRQENAGRQENGFKRKHEERNLNSNKRKMARTQIVKGKAPSQLQQQQQQHQKAEAKKQQGNWQQIAASEPWGTAATLAC